MLGFDFFRVFLFFNLMQINQRKLSNKNLNNLLDENKLLVHFLNFILLLVVIQNLTGIKNPTKLLIYSVILYMLFLLTTKMEIQMVIMFLGLLLALYFYYLANEEKISRIIKDQEIEQKFKDSIINLTEENYTQAIFLFTMFILLGVWLYNERKQEQYQENYNLVTFLFS